MPLNNESFCHEVHASVHDISRATTSLLRGFAPTSHRGPGVKHRPMPRGFGILRLTNFNRLISTLSAVDCMDFARQALTSFRTRRFSRVGHGFLPCHGNGIFPLESVHRFLGASVFWSINRISGRSIVRSDSALPDPAMQPQQTPCDGNSAAPHLLCDVMS